MDHAVGQKWKARPPISHRRAPQRSSQAEQDAMQAAWAAKVDALRSGAEARFQAAVAAEDAGLAQYVDERERSAGTAAVELQRARADRERRWARESVEAVRK